MLILTYNKNISNVYNMKRTQVYLTEDMLKSIKELSNKMGKNQAEVVRQLLSVGLKQAQEQERDPIRALSGKYSSKHKDTTQNIDEILYGKTD